MCVYSMIVDYTYDKWRKHYPGPYEGVPSSAPVPPRPIHIPTQEEVAEFYELLRRAREYDLKHNQPDCETEEKKKKLADLAEQLGVKIEFPEG